MAEEVEKGGLEQDVELGEGLAALGLEGVCRVEDSCDALLLRERWERKHDFLDDFLWRLP